MGVKSENFEERGYPTTELSSSEFGRVSFTRGKARNNHWDIAGITADVGSTPAT
jgi:hypothetical protein